jgi:hypothetical protein
MGKLSDYTAGLPPVFVGRYTASGLFIVWMNQLLEELQERGFLSAQIKECGQIVHNGIWITPPSDMILLEKVYNPEDERQVFRVEKVNNLLKMMDVTLDPGDTEFDTVTFFSYSTVSSIKCDVTDKAEDVYENYLFYITAGDLAGTGIILSGNEVSETTETQVNYQLDRESALLISGDVIDCDEAQLVPPQYYVVIKYHSLIAKITTAEDEIPIPDDCEERLVPTYLRWCCERETMAVSKETQYWQNEKDKILYSIQAKRSARVNPARGRRLVGYESTSGLIKTHPPYSSCG